MAGPVRITRIDGAALADCLYLIGLAVLKSGAGDEVGADEDLAAARRLAPVSAVRSVLRMIASGELPAPGPGPEAMDEWLETCRMAGAGDLALVRQLSPAELAQDERDAFHACLDKIQADAERRKAAGELGPPPEMPPERPPPWEADSLKGLDRPGSLSESLRKMGLM